MVSTHATRLLRDFSPTSKSISAERFSPGLESGIVDSMSFLHPQRGSLQGNQFKEKYSNETDSRPSSLVSSASAIENVPQKSSRNRVTSGLGASRIMQHVSSMFAPKTRKKPPPDLKLIKSAFNSNLPNLRRVSSTSSFNSEESEDDIRRPSDLGDAVSIRSLPPSPFTPISPQYESPLDAFPSPPGGFARSRTISTPNSPSFLRFKVQKHKLHARKASVPRSPIAHPIIITPKPPIHLPQEVIALILSKLPQRDAAVCAVLSRAFASAARTTLYNHLDFDSLSPAQSEKLVALLGSRRDLTDLVTSFICRKWPAFFPSSYNINGQARTHSGNGHITKDQDALLTATFTLALERMPNLQSLTLPSFNASLLAYHTAFGLKTVRFVYPMIDSEIRELFTWLDGQTNITCLSLKDAEEVCIKPSKLTPVNPLQDKIKAGTAPSSPLLRALLPNNGVSPLPSPSSSPRSAFFVTHHSLPLPPNVSSSSTLLPNLTTLHATPAIVALLSPPLMTSPQRPLKSVALDISTTLYNGLRPVSLMNSLRGVSHLTLRFTDNVDKRTFEKVLGAVGASLGDPSKTVPDETSSADDSSSKSPLSGWLGLQLLEICFVSPPGKKVDNKDEALYALYKSLQASLARYKALFSLSLNTISDDHSNSHEDTTKQHHQPVASEQIMIDCWAKMCPTLTSITLFSGAHWRGKPLPSLPDSEIRSQKHNAFPGSKVFKFP